MDLGLQRVPMTAAKRSRGGKRSGGTDDDIEEAVTEEDVTEVNETPTEGRTSPTDHETAVRKGVRVQGLHGVDVYTHLHRAEEERLSKLTW